MRVGILHTAFIGDIVLTGLLVEGLYQAKHEIIFFTKPKTGAVFQNDVRVSKVVLLNKPNGLRKLFAFKQMVQQIKNERLDALLCPHRSLTTTLCAYFSGIKLTVGFQTATLSSLYQIRRPFIQKNHECLRYLSLIPAKLCPPELLNAVAKIGRPLLRYPAHIGFSSKPYFVVAIGTVWNTKKYVRQYLSEICEHILSKNPRMVCFLTGDKTDMPDCEIFEKSLQKYSSQVVNTAGQLSLMDYIARIANASFIISNDSSPLHLSSAFNIPVICFFGPTSSEHGFGPVSERNLVISHKTIFGANLNCQPCGTHGAKSCPQKHHLCMKKLEPKFVLPKIMEFLN